MDKTPITGAFHSPLAVAMGTRAKVVTLRELWRSGEPLSCQEIARLGGMAFRSIDLALTDLLATGLVERVGGRRERLVRAAAGHRLAPAVAALLRAEADFFPAIRSELSAVGRSGDSGMEAVAIIGAVADGVERPSDMLQLLVVTSTEPGVRRWVDRFVAAGAGMTTRFGVRIDVTGYDLTTARRMWATRTPAAERLVRGAKSIVGPPLEQLFEESGGGSS